MDRGEEEYNEDTNQNYNDEPYDDTPTKRKRGRPKGSTKTTNKKPKAELAEGEIKMKMGRAWYAVNDQKREFRYFTGLQEGEVPCSKKEEKEVKRRLNGYTRLLSNGRSKIAIFEDVDKDQQEQDLGHQDQQNFEHVYNNEGAYQQEYHYPTGEDQYQNQDYQNQQHMYQQHMYQSGEGEYNQGHYQQEYQNQNDGNMYGDHNNMAYHNPQQDMYMYQQQQQMQHDYSNMQHYNQDGNLYQQQIPQDSNTNANTTYHTEKKGDDDDEEYQPEAENENEGF